MLNLRCCIKFQAGIIRFFSSGGRKVFIKAAVQAITPYAMSVFKLPRGLCDGIQRAIARFW